MCEAVQCSSSEVERSQFNIYWDLSSDLEIINPKNKLKKKILFNIVLFWAFSYIWYKKLLDDSDPDSFLKMAESCKGLLTSWILKHKNCLIQFLFEFYILNSIKTLSGHGIWHLDKFEAIRHWLSTKSSRNTLHNVILEGCNLPPGPWQAAPCL